MRKITFDADTINEIREFAKTHRFMETCNRFTLKPDVLHRLEREYGLEFIRGNHSNFKDIPQESIDVICNLYANTNTGVADIVSTVHMRRDRVMSVIRANFSEEYISNRKKRLYSLSKQGANNPWFGKFKELHPNYKGLVSDGKGYLMCLKPDWYTGRKGCNHIFAHTLVMCEALGLTELPKDFVVHHIDGDKHNNDISNLALLTSSAHSRLHSIQRKMCKVQRSEDNRREDEDIPETPDND